VGNDIGVSVFRQMKPDRDSARARIRAVVGYRRHTREVRNPDGDRRLRALQMGRTRKRLAGRRRSEHARKQESFGMRRPKAWMHTVQIIESLQ
jgi:hypothetical protein